MDYRKQGSHARGVCPTQGTSRMATAARVKKERKSRHQNKKKIGVRNMEENNVRTKGKVPNKAKLATKF